MFAYSSRLPKVSLWLALGSVVGATVLLALSPTPLLRIDLFPLEPLIPYIPYRLGVVAIGFLVLLVAMATQGLSYNNNIIGKRQFTSAFLLQTLLFLLLPWIWGRLVLFGIALLLLGAYKALFALYDRPTHRTLHTKAGLCISMGSILYPPTLLFGLPLLIAFISLRAFSFRSLLAFLYGFFIPLLLLLPIGLSLNSWLPLGNYWLSYCTLHWIGACNFLPAQLLAMGVLIVVAFFILGLVLLSPHPKKAHIRAYVTLLVQSLLVLPMGLFLGQQFPSLLFLLILPLSILGGYLLPIRSSKAVRWAFLFLWLAAVVVWLLTYL